MKTKILLAVLVLVGLVSWRASVLCIYGSLSGANGPCYGTWIDQITGPVIQPIYFLSLFGSIAILISLFMPERIFRAWLRFAIYFVLIAIVVIAATPVTFTGIFPPPIDFWRNDMARLMGQIFAIITAVFFAWKVIAIKRAGKKDAVPYRAQP